MKHSIWVTVFFAVAAWLGPGTPQADIYKYVDQNGRIHYTNNPETIPHASRNNVVVDQEVKSTAPSAKPTPAEPQESASEILPPAEGTDPLVQFQKENSSVLSAKQAVLEEQRQALDNERDALKAELDRLEAAREKANSKREVKRLNAEIDQYNQRATTFQKQREIYKQEQAQFQKEVDAYEDELKKQLEAAKERMENNASQPAATPALEETP